MVGVFQLKAGKLQHPHIRRFAFALHIGFQHRRADIARDNGIEAALLAQITGQAGHGGFAVAAGNRDDLIAAPLQQVGQNFDIADHAVAALFKRFNLRLALADAGAEC